MARFEPGEEVLFWEFDRIGRNSLNVVDVAWIKDEGAPLRRPTERIDISGPNGSGLFTIMTVSRS